MPDLRLIMDLRLAPMLSPTVPAAAIIPIVISSYRREILHCPVQIPWIYLLEKPLRKRLPAYDKVTAFSALVRAT